MRICEVEGCKNKHRAKGLCFKHYAKKWRNSEHGKSLSKQWHQSEKGKALHRFYSKRYYRTERARNTKNIYRQSEQCKLSNKRYHQSEKGEKVRKAYRATERGKKVMIKARKNYEQFNPEKIKAQRLARSNIKRQQCEIENCNTLGARHHDDYSKPLEVRFLCRQHHDDFHVEKRRVS